VRAGDTLSGNCREPVSRIYSSDEMRCGESLRSETLHDTDCMIFILSLFRKKSKQVYIRPFDAPCVTRVLRRRR